MDNLKYFRDEDASQHQTEIFKSFSQHTVNYNLRDIIRVGSSSLNSKFSILYSAENNVNHKLTVILKDKEEHKV